MRITLKNGFQKIHGISEWILIKQVKSGNREAFGKLYSIYLDKIYRFIYFKVGQQKELAEDLTADVFVKAWSKIATFKQQKNGSFQAWLYMIARNTIVDNFRSSSVKHNSILHEDIVDHKQNIEEKVHVTLEIERVQRAVEKLTDEQQEIIILKYTNDLSNQEIAIILGKHEDAIRALQHRAIKELRELLG